LASSFAGADRSSDKGWPALLRAGGKPRQAAISQIYTTYGGAFKGYFRRHGRSEAQAEDLLQETFVKVLRSIDSWSGTGAFEAWLWTIARNTLISEVRSSAMDKATVSLDDQEPETAELMVGRDGAASDPADADCVKRGLEAFAKKFVEYALVLERIALDGWSDVELSQFRNCSPGAAREYISQCRKRVWQFIGHCYEAGAH